MKRPKTPLKLELPLIAFLGFFWMAIWQDFTLGTFLIGAIYATIIVRVFYLPPLRGSGRLNPWWGLVFTVRFLVKMVAASFQVSWISIVVGPKVKNSIISVQLRSHDDLIVTLTGHALALVPGSLVLDVDRTTATLYLHALDVDSDEDAERIRQDALEDRGADHHDLRQPLRCGSGQGGEAAGTDVWLLQDRARRSLHPPRRRSQ